MWIRTRITQKARERGWTAAEVARRLKLYPSNLSAMDAGKRAVSLSALHRLAQTLGCSPGDLLEGSLSSGAAVLFGQHLRKRLEARDLGTPDGLDRSWVHASLLAWQRHQLARDLKR